MRQTLIGIAKVYSRFLSPWLGRRCRFVPSCSQYAAEAVAQHGCAKGLWLSLRRLGRCHPFNRGGYDPVPTLSDEK